MAAEMIGMASEIERVSLVDVSVSAGITEEAAGFSSTSSKVRYSGSSAAKRSGAMPTSSLGDAGHRRRRFSGAGESMPGLSGWRLSLAPGRPCGKRSVAARHRLDEPEAATLYRGHSSRPGG
jgi:hypothetical protein